MRRLFLLGVFWGSMSLIFVDPFYGVVYYHLINIMRPEQLLWGDTFAVGRIFLAVQAFSLISWIINKNKLTPEYTPLPFQVIFLWVLAGLMSIASYLGFDPDWGWYWVSGFWKMTVFCFVVSKSVNTAEKVERLYAACLLVFALLAMWGIQQKLGGNTRMEGLGGNVLPDVNTLAAVFVLYFPMTYYSIFSRKKWIKLFVGIPTFIIFVIFILFGGSRGAFLGMTTCILIIFHKAKGTQKFKMLFTMIIVGSLLGLVLVPLAPKGFFDEYTARLATIMGEKDEESGETVREGSAAGRTAMWKGALAIYKNHPEYWLFGVGMNCYPRMYIQHIDEIAAVLDEREFSLIFVDEQGGRQLHSSYVGVLLGGGAIVFLAWLFLIFYSWNQARLIPKKYPQIVNGINIHNYAQAIEIGIVGYCVCITFLNMEFIDLFYWHLTMVGVLKNLGKAELKHQELGLKDEEFLEDMTEKSVYAYPAY